MKTQAQPNLPSQNSKTAVTVPALSASALRAPRTRSRASVALRALAAARIRRPDLERGGEVRARRRIGRGKKASPTLFWGQNRA